MQAGTIVHCRMCGAEGLETPDDPCPGLCPPCFEDKLIEATIGLHACAELGLSAAEAHTWLLTVLRRTGVAEAAIWDVTEELRRKGYQL